MLTGACTSIGICFSYLLGSSLRSPCRSSVSVTRSVASA